MLRNRVFAYVLAGAVGGCGFQGKNPPADPDASVDAKPMDAMPDAMVDAPVVTCMTWTTLEPDVNPCGPEMGEKAALLVDGNATLNTDTGVLDRGGGNTTTLPGRTLVRTGYPTLRAINLSSFQVDATRTLTLVGSNAVLFVVHGDATIAGTITASAALPVLPAVKMPGADSARCDATRTGGTGTQADANNRGGGGGGGGALGGNGGPGGVGFNDRTGGTAGALDAEHVPLRGGCAGGRGGDNENNGSNQGGLPGGGGGAFAISARGAITVATTASLRANGAPGLEGTSARGGGGGGGAGGSIALDGATVALVGVPTLCAKGGGGGEGANVMADGNRGLDVGCDITRATGGFNGTNFGGDGGAGGSTTDSNGSVGLDGEASGGAIGGGGGGGGGAGKILLRSRPPGGVTVGTAVLAPMPITLP